MVCLELTQGAPVTTLALAHTSGGLRPAQERVLMETRRGVLCCLDCSRGESHTPEIIHILRLIIRASLVTQTVKNLPAMKTWVQSLGWEDPLEKGKATHSSILA